MEYEEYENNLNNLKGQQNQELCLDSITDDLLIHLDHLDLELPYKRKIETYIKGGMNPYVFISHGIKVMTAYTNTDITISDLLVTYFSNLK